MPEPEFVLVDHPCMVPDSDLRHVVAGLLEHLNLSAYRREDTSGYPVYTFEKTDT